MLIQQIIFYAFAFILILASLLVVTSRNPVYAVLFLILAFFASAALWIMLEAEFLALILVLVYVGAVMTLFLFVVMLLNLSTMKLKGFVRYLPFGVLILAFIVAGMLYVIGPTHFGLAAMPVPAAKPANYSNVAELGSVLYTQYVYAFELAAVLLLIAIIASISLTLRKPRAKTQNIKAQINIKRSDRIRIVDMPAEKPRGQS
ncbi:MAG: NADH-quinone oxidoreductase subunit J [Pseudomonadota bacterium]